MRPRSAYSPDSSAPQAKYGVSITVQPSVSRNSQSAKAPIVTPSGGTNSIQADSITSGQPATSHGRRRPQRVVIRSLITPTTGSEIASKARASRKTVPIAPSASPWLRA
jgi:hypothetical protein